MAKDICECADSECPIHKGTSSCTLPGSSTLYRADMVDATGTRFCEACGADAFESGLYDGDPDPGDMEQGPND